MRSISGKDLARVLQQHGRSLLRVRGSHHIFGRADRAVRLSVPIHGAELLKLGLLMHLLKLAGLTEDDIQRAP
jgi:predicted RNA binding protein YcfA (HicA-like mRNA interferase family)